MATRYGKFVDFNDPTEVEDAPARNAFELSRKYLFSVILAGVLFTDGRKDGRTTSIIANTGYTALCYAGAL